MGLYNAGFNRESDSVTVGASVPAHHNEAIRCFNRESDSVTVGAGNRRSFLRLRLLVSIAKAIPSLLERCLRAQSNRVTYRFNRESDSVTVGARAPEPSAAQQSSFNRESDSVTVGAPSRRHASKRIGGFNRESDSVTVGAVEVRRLANLLDEVSIAKAIPSLLERS